MFLLRLLLLVFLFTSIGVGLMFFTNLKPAALGTIAFLQGEQAYRNAQYEAARGYYHEALKGYPVPAQVYVKLGDTQLKMKKPQAALASYQKAMDADPHSMEALKRLAQQEWAQGRHRVALGLYLTALQGDPHNPELRANIGELYLALAKETNDLESYRRAARIFEKALENDPEKQSATRYQLAESLYALGQYQDALELYCDLAVEHPDNAETLYSLAITLAKNNASKEAYTYMSKAAELADPSHPEWTQQWADQAMRLRRSSTFYQGELPTHIKMCLTKLHHATANQTAQQDEL